MGGWGHRPLSHAVGVFIEAYAEGLVDPATLTAQLDALHAKKDAGKR